MDKLERAAAERFPVTQGYGQTFNRAEQKQRSAYIQGRRDQAEADARIAEGRHDVGWEGNPLWTARYPDDGRRIAAAIREAVETSKQQAAEGMPDDVRELVERARKVVETHGLRQSTALIDALATALEAAYSLPPACPAQREALVRQAILDYDSAAGHDDGLIAAVLKAISTPVLVAPTAPIPAHRHPEGTGRWAGCAACAGERAELS